MRTQEQNTLDGYVRQAEHFGTAEVFETALDEGLSLRDLGFLSLRLQNLDPTWKLTLDAQRMFVLALVESGVNAPTAARTAGVGVTTARTWLSDGFPYDGNGPDVSPESALRRASKERFEGLRGIVRGWHRTS